MHAPPCRGYILTAPNVFIPGRHEKVCVDLHDVTAAMTVELTLYKARSYHRWKTVQLESLVDMTSFTVSPTGKCVSVFLNQQLTSTTKIV